MVAYKFYLRDAVRNCFDHAGVLPERRMNPGRITDESIVNWGRKYFGTNAKDQDIFFLKVFWRIGKRDSFYHCVIEGENNLMYS